MKTMTCNNLGGACDQEFHAETFDKMAEMSKKHAIEMFAKNDQPHIDAMEKMTELMQDPDAMQKSLTQPHFRFLTYPASSLSFL